MPAMLCHCRLQNPIEAIPGASPSLSEMCFDQLLAFLDPASRPSLRARFWSAAPQTVSGRVCFGGSHFDRTIAQNSLPTEELWPAAVRPFLLRGKGPVSLLKRLITFLNPETTQFQYVHGVTDETLVAPESYTLDAALLRRDGNDEIQLPRFAAVAIRQFATNGGSSCHELKARLRYMVGALSTVPTRRDPPYQILV